MISVIMPVFNAQEFLNEAIDSVLAQTEKDFEFIIVNDGSVDESEKIISTYSDSRIKYITKENGGEASARNLGLKFATGDFIVWQDADDVSMPSRFQTLKRNFLNNDIGFVHSDMLLIDEKGTPLGYWQSRNIERASILRFLIKIGTPFNNPSMMIRRNIIDQFRYDTELKIGTDTDMIAKIALQTEGVHVAEPLLLYRRHSKNLSSSNDYEKLFLHVRKIVSRYSLVELVPELNWNEEWNEETECKARAIISVFLFRRGMNIDAESWFRTALNSARTPNTRNFVLALGNLALNNYQEAARLLNAITVRDHIIENYLGETDVHLGLIGEGHKHFLHAISLQPDYSEALANLRAIGGKCGLNLLDRTWAKFRS